MPGKVNEEASELVELLIDGARYGDVEDVQRAIQHNVLVNSIDDEGRAALHMAAANGHTDIVNLLLQAGADVDVQNVVGNTPLHWACLNGKQEVVRVLLENGASPSTLNRAERTPVDEALSKGFDQIVQLINSFSEELVADVELTDEEQREA